MFLGCAMAIKQSKTELVITAIDKASTIINKISSKLTDATKPVDNLGKTLGNLGGAFNNLYKATGVSGVVTSVKNVGSAVGGLIKSTVMLSGVYAGAIAGLVRFGLSAVNAASSVGVLAEKYQINAQSMQVYGAIAEKNGGNTETAAAAMGKLKKAMHEAAHGGKEQAAAFKGVGLSVAQLKKMSIDEVMLKMSDAFKSSNKDAAKQAVLMQLMGESGQSMMGVLNGGSTAIKAMKDEMQRDGRLFSDEDVAKAAKFDGVWKRLKGTFDGLKNSLGLNLAEALLPALEKLQKFLVENGDEIKKGFGEFLEKLPDILEGAAEFFKGLWETIKFVSKAVSVLNSIFGPTILIFGAVGAILSPLILSFARLTWSVGVFGYKSIGIFKAVWGVMMANPIMLIVAAVATLAIIIYKNWDKIVDYISNAWERIKSVFNVSFFDGIIQIWLESWQALGNGILCILKSVLPDFVIPDVVKNFKFTFADDNAARVTSGSVIEPARSQTTTAAEVAKQKTEVGGTLKIQIDGAPARVTELTPAGNAMGINVKTGVAMSGA